MTGDLKIFGTTFECECGKTHSIEPRRAIYADDALERIPELCDEFIKGRRIAVLMDTRTKNVAGNQVAQALSPRIILLEVVPDPKENESPVCDDITKVFLDHKIGEQDGIISVGSGVICDLGKWISSDRGIPFIAVGTAASMNGYTSANVAPTISGLKTLVRGKPPTAVLSTYPILRDAPYEMTASGLGDILAKSVSSADWFMNHTLFGDYYCARSVGLISHIEPLYLDNPEGILERRPESIEGLFHALLLTGAAMTMAETSAPSSGGEHMISHTLDMMSSVDGTPHDLHGRQVGVGTIIASEIYRRTLSLESPVFVEPTTSVFLPYWKGLGRVIQEDYSKKIPRLHQAKVILGSRDGWDRLRGSLSPMLRPPEKIRECLERARAAHKAEHIRCSRGRLLDALLHAHEIRSRFTILDLARLVGVLPMAAEEIVDCL